MIPAVKVEMPPDEPASICTFKQIAYNPRIWRLTTMPLFICRWQNGDFSAVHARSREDAIILLDEVGNAEQCELFAVRDFMVHFHLHDEVTDLEEMIPVELEGFGEDTFDMLCDRLYPVYQQAIIKGRGGLARGQGGPTGEGGRRTERRERCSGDGALAPVGCKGT
jgi:hypothetical protein